jgi:hypothetical protein
MAKPTLLELPRNEADILERLVGPKANNMSIAVARHILAMDLADEDVDRINDLSAKARDGTLAPEEDNELNSYLRIGHFLSMMKSKARATLKRSGRTA